MKNIFKRKVILVIIFFTIIIVGLVLFFRSKTTSAKGSFNEYINAWEKKDYTSMYAMLDEESKKDINEKDFVQRYTNIYEGIELKKVDVKIKKSERKKDTENINFQVSMDTAAGKLDFNNTGSLIKDEKKWKVVWSSKMIFPELEEGCKIRVDTLYGKRGQIKDKNNKPLAVDGTAAEIGIVPGKLGDNMEKSKESIASLLQVTVEEINKKITASYVKPDMFVPIKVISQDEVERIKNLLQIHGVKVGSKKARVYPLKDKSAQLVGYVQAVSAEDIEKNKEELYKKEDVIGKMGLEKMYEKTLRARNGLDIYIVDKNNKKKKTLISKAAKDGEDLKLTIDSDMQSILYDELSSDAGTAVAMNPKTGEVLALVSTPSYNPNDFVMGMSQETWKNLNENKKKPLYNRFQSNLCPGSVFKPVTAAIGLKTNKINPEATKNISGLKWQKDKSWGGYFVTRVHDYGQSANLMNALVYSDNIYFAQAALDIGKSTLQSELGEFGLGEEIPFEYSMSKSQFATNKDIKSDIQLADSGYGQGEILLNPLHLAAIYSSYVNSGSMIKPYLLYKDNATPEFWKKNVFPSQVADLILKDLNQVVERPEGTGHQAYINGLKLAGKTGTAEIKLSQQDTNGTELGWFAAVNTDNPRLLVVAMAEDVKERGGSHYVVPKVKKAFEGLK